jgi:hypothetical protein
MKTFLAQKILACGQTYSEKQFSHPIRDRSSTAARDLGRVFAGRKNTPYPTPKPVQQLGSTSVAELIGSANISKMFLGREVVSFLEDVERLRVGAISNWTEALIFVVVLARVVGEVVMLLGEPLLGSWVMPKWQGLRRWI